MPPSPYNATLSGIAPAEPRVDRSDSPEQTAAQQAGVQRLAFLDALRGIAVLSVFLYHAGVMAPLDIARAIEPFFHLGNFGVMLFFLCSGFIIPVSLERSASLGAFWARRITRLYPPYWASIALYAVIGLWFGRGEAVGALLAAPAPVILANMTMFQPLFDQPHLSYSYWTLLFEMLFYLLVSGLFFVKLLRHTALITVTLCLAAIVLEALLPHLFGAAKPVLGLVGFLATMFLGTLLYRVHSGRSSWRQAAPVLLLGGVMMVATALTLPAGERGIWGYGEYVTARLLALGVFLLACAYHRRPTPRPLRFLGQISYSLYLLHMTVILLIRFDTPLLNMLAWTVGALALATASYYGIERPAMRAGLWLTGRTPAGSRSMALRRRRADAHPAPAAETPLLPHSA